MSDSAPSDDTRTVPAGTEAASADHSPAPAAKKPRTRKSASDAAANKGQPTPTRPSRSTKVGDATEKEKAASSGKGTAPELPHISDSFPSSSPSHAVVPEIKPPDPAAAEPYSREGGEIRKDNPGESGETLPPVERSGERGGDVKEGRSRRNRGPRQRRRKGNRESHPGGEHGSRRDVQDQPQKGRDRRSHSQQGGGQDGNRDHPDDDRNLDPREVIGGEAHENGDDRTGDSDDGTDRGQNKTRKQRYLERKEKERIREAAALEAAPAVESEGIVEISPKGFGFLREKIRGFQQSPKDVFITPEVVREYGLRDGLMVRCVSKEGVRGPQLIELLTINDRPPEESARLPYFEELTAINPNKKLTLETESTRATTRVIDLMAPIGRGQRGLIVAPPRTGKTTLLHHIAEGILHNYDDEIHLMVLLVDERPEEVTDFERSFPNVEVFSSSNDSEAKDHTRIALLATERAKRLVEGGRHVVMLMDSITRLARAFNSQMRGGKRGTASGGLIVGALEVPRRIFAAARNTREAGSLTIIATALVQTNSKADEAIFQEFKGTGNMELVLDRQIAQNYVYPAVDINKSGTRREELLLPPHVLEKIYVIRRGLSGYKQVDAMEWILKCMQRYPSNAQMLMDIKTTALS